MKRNIDPLIKAMRANRINKKIKDLSLMDKLFLVAILLDRNGAIDLSRVVAWEGIYKLRKPISEYGAQFPSSMLEVWMEYMNKHLSISEETPLDAFVWVNDKPYRIKPEEIYFTLHIKDIESLNIESFKANEGSILEAILNKVMVFEALDYYLYLEKYYNKKMFKINDRQAAQIFLEPMRMYDMEGTMYFMDKAFRHAVAGKWRVLGKYKSYIDNLASHAKHNGWVNEWERPEECQVTAIRAFLDTLLMSRKKPNTVEEEIRATLASMEVDI